MKKINFNKLLLFLIPLGLFNAMFFLLGGAELNDSVWISYGFIHLAFLTLLLTPLFVAKGTSRDVYFETLYTVSVVYFILAFLAGLICIFINPDTYTVPLVIQIFLLGIYLIVFLANRIFNESTAKNESIRKKEINFIKTIKYQLEEMARSEKDDKKSKLLEKVYDSIISSPTKSCDDVKGIEEEIMSLINDMEIKLNEYSADELKDASEKIISLVKKRNNLVRLSY